MQEAEHVTHFVDGDLEEVDSSSVAVVVLVVVKVDVPDGSGVGQFAPRAIELPRAVQVRF